MSACQGCGTPIPPSRGGPRRKWCSERCRRHTLYSGECVDCGAPTYSGTVPPSDRCVQCSTARQKAAAFWTSEAIVGAIQAWANLTGAPPAATDWNTAQARAYGHPEKAERFIADGCWPATSTVQEAFGSWNAGIKAAGLVPRRYGCYGRDGEDPDLCREIAERYAAGESSRTLAKEYGCHCSTIEYRIVKAGGRLRSVAEAQRLRWERVKAAA